MALRTTDFDLLLQANRALSSKLDLGEVLSAVMEMATQVVRAQASSLLLLDEKRNELYFDVALGLVGDSLKNIRLKVGEGIAGWVAKERQPLIVNDVSHDARFTQKVDKSTKFITKSILAVPLMVKGQLIGVVEAINKEQDQDFSVEDQEAFEAFASQAAISIQNARLFSEMMREKEKLNTIFTEMSEGVVFLDDDFKVVILNEAAGRLLGVEAQGAIGSTFSAELLPEFDITPPLSQFREVKEGAFQAEFIRRKGKDLALTANIHKIQATKELPQGGALLFLRDVTEARREEYLKRNFLSLISHKLRTPLTVILGYGPALSSKTENLSEFQRKAVQSICDQGARLSGLVDKLLRFTLVESETLNKNIESTSLSVLVQETIRQMEPLARESHGEVVVDPGVATLAPILIDRSLTMEVFKNLIENGFKFNDKEKKTVHIAAETDSTTVRVHVKDNGVGIPSEEKEKVFQKFYQIESSFTGQIPGAGLGLSLCRKVMEAMGGSISIESQLGQGTTVTLTFRIQ